MGIFDRIRGALRIARELIEQANAPTDPRPNSPPDVWRDRGSSPLIPAIELAPLKPHHRRRLIEGDAEPSGAEPRHELARLLADEAQLARNGLPVWGNRAAVAQALGHTEAQMSQLVIRSRVSTVSHYVRYEIPKRTSGMRTIYAPKKRLRELQRAINRELASKLPVSEHAHAFIKGHSVRTNAQAHVGRKIILQMDLANFFHSITAKRVRGLLISLGYSFDVADWLSELVTERERTVEGRATGPVFVASGPRICVQGAPTSPAIANAILHRMDRRLAALARWFGFAYTRYADDMTFSGDDPKRAYGLASIARQVIEREGFKINRDKTRVLRRRRRQIVTGVVVNDKPTLPRVEKRRLRAAVHHENAGKLSEEQSRKLSGKLGYLNMIDDQAAKKLLARRNRKS